MMKAAQRVEEELDRREAAARKLRAQGGYTDEQIAAATAAKAVQEKLKEDLIPAWKMMELELVEDWAINFDPELDMKEREVAKLLFPHWYEKTAQNTALGNSTVTPLPAVAPDEDDDADATAAMFGFGLKRPREES